MTLTSEQRAELVALERIQEHVEPIEEFVARITPELTPIPRHQQKVFDLFTRSRTEEVYATIAEPPRHGKSTALQVGLAWRTLYDPACLNFYATYGSHLSMAMSRKIRKLVRLAKVPLSSEVQNVNEWETAFGGGLKATSTGGDVTGRGSNGGIVIGDDLVKGRKQAESKLVRDDTWNWLRDDYMSRLEPGTSFFVNATRWHEDDVIGRLHEDPLGLDWNHIVFPAVVGLDGSAADERTDPNARALWPEGGWDLARLARIRMRGENGWWSLYQQTPMPRGGGMFKGLDFQYVDQAPEGGRVVRSWDLAASTSADSAFTAGVKVKYVNGSFFVEDVERGQWNTHERDARILKTAEADGRRVHIRLPQDPGQAGKSQKPHFLQLLAGFIVHFEIEREEKSVRAEPYASQVGGHNWYLVRAPWNKAYVAEHEPFPRGRVKDQVDASSGAHAHLISTGGSVPDGGYGSEPGAATTESPHAGYDY